METINHMMDYVKSYINDEIERWKFVQNFSYKLMKYWHIMEFEDPDYAHMFNFWITQKGFYAGSSLPNSEYKKLIKRQYNKVKTMVNEVSDL